MSRFYVPRESVNGKIINVRGEEAHHMLDVMRLKVSDTVVTFDGTGREYAGFIREIRPGAAVIEITETRAAARGKSPEIVLAQAVPKKAKMDYIVEKATELGVSGIIPLVTARTIPRWDAAKKKAAADRWRKIALEASKQCGRADIPEIGGVTGFSDIIADSGSYGMALIAALDERAMKLKDALRPFGSGKIMIAIGPEGDFTPDEIDAAREAGFKLVNLGQRVMKSDTAGLFVLSVLNHEFTN